MKFIASNSFQRISKGLLTASLLGLALLPAGRMLYLVLTIGENNLSNDYLGLLDVTIELLKNHFLIGDLGQICFRWQCEPVPIYLMGLLAAASHWNVRLEMVVAILIAAASCLLIYISLVPRGSERRQLGLLVIISALAFSLTEISTFTFGITALYSTTALFGICLVLCSVTRLPGSSRGITLLILGTWIAVWSYGAGLLAIPISVAGIALAFRQRRFYLSWLVSVVLMAVPYVQYYLYHTAAAANPRLLLHSIVRVDWIAQALGLFFSNHLTSNAEYELIPTGMPQVFGYFGGFLLLLALFFLFRRYGFRGVSRCYAELGLVAFGIGAIWQISIIREGIAPWYVSDAAPFWIGLIGLYFAMISRNTEARPRSLTPVKVTFAILLALAAMLYINSNLSYDDKVFHIRSRAPASAACLRNYASAPTYCEGFLFQWGLGNPQSIFELGRPLKAAGLSVFAPGQEWSLQGDYLLHSVRITPSTLGQNPVWIDDQGHPASWGDYHHLNLALPVDTSLDWSVDLPAPLLRGEFTTDVLLSGEPNTDPSTMHKIQAQVTLSTMTNGTGNVLQQFLVPVNFDAWTPVRIPLTSYAGRRITIALASDAPARKKRLNLVFRYPHISLTADSPSRTTADTYQPENVVPTVDPASSHSLFATNPDGSLDQHQLTLTDLSVDFPQRLFSQPQGAGGKLSFRPDASICVDDQTQFYFTEALDSTVAGRYANLLLELSAPGTGQYYRSTFIPLLPDSAPHTYLFPLRLLLDSSPAGVSQVEFTPLSDSGSTTYRILDVGFMGAAAPAGGCP